MTYSCILDEIFRLGLCPVNPPPFPTLKPHKGEMTCKALINGFLSRERSLSSQNYPRVCLAKLASMRPTAACATSDTSFSTTQSQRVLTKICRTAVARLAAARNRIGGMT